MSGHYVSMQSELLVRLKADVFEEHCRVEEVYRFRDTAVGSRADLLPISVDIHSKRHMLSVSRFRERKGTKAFNEERGQQRTISVSKVSANTHRGLRSSQ